MNENPHDEQLFLHCRAGDRQAFAEVTTRYGKPVYGFLSAFLGGNASRKKELMHLAFAEGFTAYQPQESSQSLLVLVMQALFKMLVRENPAPPVEEAPGAALHIQWILKTLMQLSVEEKGLILLRLQMDFLYEEIAFVFSLSEPTVKQKLKNARLRFRELVAVSMKGQYRELRKNSGKDTQLS